MNVLVNMAKYSFAKLPQFRESFVKDGLQKKIISWFPGHMYKGMLQMQAKLAVVDCIVEVHDARIPFSGRNPKFHTMLSAIKPHVLVLNKMDLADLSSKSKIENELTKQNIKHVVFTNCKHDTKNGVNKIIPTLVDALKNTEQYSRCYTHEVCFMVIGVPNVGKSSLINRLRNMHTKKKKATIVGSMPGITRTVLERIKISDEPLVYVRDTPGVMQPTIDNVEVGLRLALCHTLRDDLVGEELVADYLLYWMNKHRNFAYVNYLKLAEPTDDIRIVLLHIAKELNLLKKILNFQKETKIYPDTQAACMHFINAFRSGELGKVLLDDDHFNKIV